MAEVQKNIDSTSPHILVVDDDTRIRQLLQRYLMENGFRVTTAKDAGEAREYIDSLTFDLLVLDVMMPGESGLELTTDLRRFSDVPILMLTARSDPEDRISGLETGADDYLPKPFEPRELLLRIGTIMRRTQADKAETSDVTMGACRFDIERGDLTREGEPVKLTSSEAALLRVLAANPGQPFSRYDLSDRMGTGLERSIDVQINRLRKKIEANPKIPRYLQTVRGVGYMLVPD